MEVNESKEKVVSISSARSVMAVEAETTDVAQEVTTEVVQEEPSKFGPVIDEKLRTLEGEELLAYLESVPDKYITHMMLDSLWYHKMSNIKNKGAEVRTRLNKLVEESAGVYNFSNKPASRREVDGAISNAYSILLNMIKELADENERLSNEIISLKGTKPSRKVTKVPQQEEQPQEITEE